MLVQLIVNDNDSGRPATRMGQGPGHILAGDPAGRLRVAGHQVETVRIGLRGAFPTEITAAFEVAAATSRQVRMARRQRRFPIVLSGNCFVSVGVVAGLRARREAERIALLWLDAHADLHTPETTRSGFLDGMALSVLAGHCWGALAGAIPGFRPTPPRDILLVGARDVDDAEELRIAEHGVGRVTVAELRGPSPSAPQAVVSHAEGALVHLHVDLDVMDPQRVAPANGFAAPDGMSADELLSLVHLVASGAQVGSLTLSAYDPSYDRGNAVRDVALTLIDTVCAAAH